MNNEAKFDHDAYARFGREHNGKTPLEVIGDAYPRTREALTRIRRGTT